MAWNLPEDQQKPKVKPDPWTGTKTKASSPPTLEALLRSGWLKARRYVKSPRSWRAKPKVLVIVSVAVVVAAWAGLGLHYVSNDRLAYVLRFGAYQGQLSTGWQWRAWGLYQVKLLPQPVTVAIANEVMTSDLNLSKVSMTFTYRIADPKAYLFNLTSPLHTLNALAGSALQQAVGQVKLATLLSENNPPAVSANLKRILQALTNQAGLGLSIETVSLNQVAIPEPLQELFNKMNALYLTQSAEKEKSLEYQQQVLPPAELKAQLGLSAAKVYEQQLQLKARADVADFLNLLPSFEKNPKLVKYQLYSQAMTTILSESSTVVVDSKGPAPMIMVGNTPLNKTAVTSGDVSPPDNSIESVDEPASDSYGAVKGGYG